MVQDAADHPRVVDQRDQLETALQRGHARTSNPNVRCISSAHSQFVRGRAVVPAPRASGATSGAGRWPPASGAIATPTGPRARRNTAAG